MKDHKVVVTPDRLTLERQVHVEKFVVAQDEKVPSFSTLLDRTEKPPLVAPGPVNDTKRGESISRSLDTLQGVYDRLGVNYVRGENSVDFFDNHKTISIDSKTRKVTHSSNRETHTSNISIVSELSSPFQLRNKLDCSASLGEPTNGTGMFSRPKGFASLHQRNCFHNDESRQEKDERSFTMHTRTLRDDIVPSGRSVKSMLSVFGGGKSNLSSRSFNASNLKTPPQVINATLSEKSKPEHRFLDEDADMAVSVASLDDSQSVRKEEEEKQDLDGKGSISSPRSWLQKSSFDHNSQIQKSKDMSNNQSFGNGALDEHIKKMMEEKVQAKFALLTASFDKKVAQIEKNINTRLEIMETRLKAILKNQESFEKNSSHPIDGVDSMEEKWKAFLVTEEESERKSANKNAMKKPAIASRGISYDAVRL